MKTMCGCTKQIKMRNGQCVIVRKRCVCWHEVVRVRPRARCNCNIEGMSLQLIESEDQVLPTACPIIFDEILFKNSHDMCCHEHEGRIEICRRGGYIVDWDVAIEDAPHSDFARFGIEVNGDVVATSTLPTKAGQLTGQALIEVEELPTTLRLINDTGEAVKLSKHSPIANLRITTLN